MTNLNSKELLEGVTPGPWRLEEGTTLVWGACDPGDRSTYGMGYPIAQARVRLGAATEYASEFREDEAEANARLIASAPRLARRVIELEEALKPFAAKVDYCDALELADDDYADCAPMKAGDYRRARAALTIQGEAK